MSILVFTSLLLIILFSPLMVYADEHQPMDNEAAFITTWLITDSDLELNIPVDGEAGKYTVDWGDDTPLAEFIDSDATHTYTSLGEYTVSITGDFNKIYLVGSNDAASLLSVVQWGDIQWSSMFHAFNGATNMQFDATDIPNLTNVNNMNNMFRDATSFNSDISNWNVTNVKYMDNIFRGATAFNQPLNSWDVSNVIDMYSMFRDATAFDQPLNSWDVSNVQFMEYMFRGAISFNSDISGWDVGNVIEMHGMFRGATAFNQPLNSWDVSNVIDMNNMFRDATAFNSDISNWDVGNVNIMTDMFRDATAFNSDISEWNVTNVFQMDHMFRDATAFNSDISEWNVTNVFHMGHMFHGATDFNQPLDNWDVGNVKYMGHMFHDATAFNQPLDNWNVLSVIVLKNMFLNAVSFNQNIATWVLGLDFKFDDLNVPESNHSVVFADLVPFITTWLITDSDLELNIPVDNEPGVYVVDWGDGNIQTVTDSDARHTYDFADTYTVSITEDFKRINISDSNDAASLLSVVQWGATKWVSMNRAFSDAVNMNVIATDVPDLSRVYDMSRMFHNATSFNSDISEWDVSNIQYMNEMFRGTTSFNQPLNNWDVDNVTDMTGMFRDATVFNQPLDNWNVSNKITMNQMFDNAVSFNSDISEWDVSNVEYMNEMFRDATAFDSDISKWDVRSVIFMFSMFHNATSFNQSLNSWDVTNVGHKENMFYGATFFDPVNISNWKLSCTDFISLGFPKCEPEILVSPKSGGGSSGDTTPPSLTTSFDEGTETIFINGMGIVPGVNKLDHILDESITVQVGDVVPFSITLYENTGWQNIAFVEICLNISGNRNISCGSDTAISWDKNKPGIGIIDPHEFISDSSVIVKEVDGVATFNFFITFANLMDSPHIQFHFWDSKRNSASFSVENALTVIDAEPIQESLKTHVETEIDIEPEEVNQIDIIDDIIDDIIIPDPVIVSEQINSEDYVTSEPTFQSSPKESISVVDSYTEVHVEVESPLKVDDFILEPSCGAGTVLQNGMCEVDTSKQNIEPNDENWLSVFLSWLKF